VLAQRACATVGDQCSEVREHERQKPLPCSRSATAFARNSPKRVIRSS
jgi:hypothetical protein